MKLLAGWSPLHNTHFTSLDLVFLKHSEGSSVQKILLRLEQSNSPKVPSLENMVGVVSHPIQAAIAFGELSNLYGVMHYPDGHKLYILAYKPDVFPRVA